MRKRLVWAVALMVALGISVAGIAGAYSYGRNYDLYRGFAVPAQMAHAGRGKLLTVRFYSAALHRRADYVVYLPPGYSRRQRYPVYYLLHGMPGDPAHFLSISAMDIRLDNQISLHRAPPMLLVYPDGQIGGSSFSDSEWANTSAGAYDSYVIDVLHDVDHRFATLARRQDRVIAGCSAGAYGAVNVALHHLNNFGSVQSWSGYFLQTKSGVFAHASHAALAYNSPLGYTRQLRSTLATYPLRASMIVGRGDPAYSQQQPMVRLLRLEGARVQYHVYPGGHDWGVWIPHLNEMLDIASYDMTHPLFAQAASARPRVRAAPVERAKSGRLVSVRFFSPALHRRADYFVYLPPGYSDRQRYPVYYLLHGMPGGPQHFMMLAQMDQRLVSQTALHRAGPMLLVYPDGQIGGSSFSDSEWANTSAGAYDSYVIDVLHDVDHRFATLARRQDRVIAGCSAGAYGAVNVALHHLNNFGSVQSWSGYFLQTKSGVFAHASHAALAYNSPLGYTRQLRSTLATYPLRASMIVGRGDPAYSQQQPMVRLLRLEGARVQYHVYPGGHGWGVWIPHLNEMLDIASADMTTPLASVSNSGPPQGSSRQGALPAAQTPSGGTGAPGGGAAVHRRIASTLRLLEALLLALVSAALINLGFVFQHRGHSQRRAGPLSVVRDRSWLIGQGVGWLGFLGQIAAVALAPLTVVQTFSAGSLALSVPLVARLFGHRVGRPQLAAISVIALSLATLPIGLGGGHGHLHAGTLIGGVLVTILIAGVLAPGGGPLRLAIAAGLLYGAGDAAIKAAAVALRVHHPAGSVGGWAALVAFCTCLGFLSFQAALRKGDAIQPLTLMNAFAAVAAALLGITAFGESLGSTPTMTIVHAVAIALVLVSVRPLAAAQQRLIDPDANGSSSSVTAAGLRVSRAGQPRRVVRGALTLLLSGGAIVIASALVVGLLYDFRGLGWFSRGPRIGDALPLLQLAGFDRQPFGWVLVAGLLGGVALGVAPIGLQWRGRAVTATLIIGVLLFESDASYALAHNLRLGSVLTGRSPGAGPWIEGLLLVGGCLAMKLVLKRARGAAPAASTSGWVPRLRLHRAAASDP